MTDKEKKIIYVGMHAADDPEKAAMPFVLACAALAMNIKVSITLQGNGVYLAKKDISILCRKAGAFHPCMSSWPIFWNWAER